MRAIIDADWIFQKSKISQIRNQRRIKRNSIFHGISVQGNFLIFYESKLTQDTSFLSRANDVLYRKHAIYNYLSRNLRDYAYSMWINQWMEENQCITIEYKYIGINFHNSIPQNIFQVLNNCVISLGRVSHLPRIDRDGFRVRAVNHNSPGGDFMSLGWGWIRHCDIESGILNIHSSLPINKLMELGINSISVGNLPLPTAITNAINRYCTRSIYFIAE